MSSDDYQAQDVYRYNRKSYKKNVRRSSRENDISIPQDELHFVNANRSPRNDELRLDPGCSCDVDTETEAASILHKKCPVITLAQQQLQRLLNETDKMICGTYLKGKK
ncbi:Uncharacterized protein OBRU01_23770, partial [Operophtera brumata]